jgi:predicted enzyme related to lactoylglutathione lyase
MPEKTTTLAPGTFCWPELATTDQTAAEQFYSKLFGWRPDAVPMGPDMHYTIFKVGDRDAGAATTLMPEQLKQGVPPHWNSYVSVANADETANQVKELGGQILMAPFDVMDKGRMFVAMDTTGAVFCAWQPLTHQGAGNLDEVGGLVWTELTANGVEKAIPFYTKLLGWGTRVYPMGPEVGAYTVFTRGETAAAGAMEWPAHMKGAPSVWTPYFSVDDCDAMAKKAEGLGAKIMKEPTDVPDTGRFAIIADPQGAVFAIMKMLPMPS